MVLCVKSLHGSVWLWVQSRFARLALSWQKSRVFLRRPYAMKWNVKENMLQADRQLLRLVVCPLWGRGVLFAQGAVNTSDFSDEWVTGLYRRITMAVWQRFNEVCWRTLGNLCVFVKKWEKTHDKFNGELKLQWNLWLRSRLSCSGSCHWCRCVFLAWPMSCSKNSYYFCLFQGRIHVQIVEIATSILFDKQTDCLFL